MASSCAPGGHGGGDAIRSGDAKCKRCRKERRTHCVKAPGASKCVRCEALGVLCVTPINLGSSESQEERPTPGEYCRELLRPTTLHKTRLAVAQLVEDLTRLRLAGGQLPDQVLGSMGLLMRRAQAANDLALLHSAVSLNASLHLNSSMGSLVDAEAGAEAASQQRQLAESLAAEGNEHILHRRALDGVQSDGLAEVRQVVHSGLIQTTCNELFKSTFFDVTNKEIKAPYYDLTVALVDDESKEALKALDEKVAQQVLFDAVPQSPSGLCLFSATSDAPLVLVGRTGERLTATLRFDGAWPPDATVTIAYVSLIGLRAEKIAESGGNPRRRQAAAASTGLEAGRRPLQQGHSEQDDGQDHEQREGGDEGLTSSDATASNEESVSGSVGGVDDGDINFLCSFLFEGEAAEREPEQR